MPKTKCSPYKPYQKDWEVPFLDRMEELVLATEKDGKERGFSVFQKEEKMCATKTIIGKFEEISLPTKLGGHDLLGRFHTHSEEQAEPSYWDTFQAIMSDENRLCIGVPSTFDTWRSINCWDVNWEADVILGEIENLGYELKVFEEVNQDEDFRRIRNEMVDLVGDHFKEIFTNHKLYPLEPIED